jgi:N-acetylmuramoyl-L-alanine amidase
MAGMPHRSGDGRSKPPGPAPPAFDRRQALKILAAVAAGAVFPSLLSATGAFDLALEGQGKIQKGDFADAVRLLSEAVRLDPENDWAFGLLGRAYYGLGKPVEAVGAFREAIRLQPGDTYSRMMIDMLTQKPLPGARPEQNDFPELRRSARMEEQQMANRLEGEPAAGYQVRRVVIDPGHGGFDSGAVGSGGLQEKEVTLALGIGLHERLAREGKIRSFLTRTGDYFVPLGGRTSAANQYRADLLVSIHINASRDRTPGGSETYHCAEKASSAEAARVAATENAVLRFDEPYKRRPGFIDIEEILFRFERQLYWDQSARFANAFQDRVKRELPLKNRGVHSANFYVLRRAKMPAILLETGFISNPEEEARLRRPDFRAAVVDAIARGFS